MARKRRKAARSRKPARARKVRAVRRARPRPHGRKRTPRAPEPAIVVHRIGTAVALELRRDSDGRTYRHQFSTKAALYRTRDGRHLLIAPVRVSSHGVIEG